MVKTPQDPLQNQSIEDFYHQFRKGTLSSESVTRDYLQRIQALDPDLGAFEYVAAEQAIQTARAMDLLRSSGVDLGPLMGVPVAIKDVFNIQGFPTLTAGSNTDISSLFDVEHEGCFIKALRTAGCVILGQTKTVEFCLGITGVSKPRGTPKNPNDLTTHRIPGGSSSGSAVAVAAGLCAFATGTDTGGSVRVPASFNGIFALKTSFGLWPDEGVFPLDPKLDSIGLLTRKAADAQTVFHAINRALYGVLQSRPIPAITVNRLYLGQPENYFFDDLSPIVDKAIASALKKLSAAGVLITPCQIPAAEKREQYFPVSLPAELLAFIGVDFFQENKNTLDPIIATRIESAFGNKAIDFIALENERLHDITVAQEAFGSFDAWVAPATTDVAPPLADFEDPELALHHAFGMTRNTQPGNYLELCAVSLPVVSPELPVGLQLMAPAGHESRLLAISAAIEEIIN